MKHTVLSSILRMSRHMNRSSITNSLTLPCGTRRVACTMLIYFDAFFLRQDVLMTPLLPISLEPAIKSEHSRAPLNKDFSCHYFLCIWKVSILLDGRRIITLGVLSNLGHLLMVHLLGRKCPCNDCFEGGICYQDRLDAMSFFNRLLARFVANNKKIGLLGD